MNEKQKMMPKHRGAYFSDDALSIGNVLLSAKSGDIRLYWLVDPTTDIVSGARYFTYGGPESIAVGEMVSEMVIGQNIDDALKITPQIDESFKLDKIVHVDDSIKKMAMEYPVLKQQAITFAPARVITKTAASELDEMWLSATKKSQLEIIERVLDLKVRPGLEQDGGNVSIIDLVGGQALTVEYQGACGSCPSSTGSTLMFIERTLKSLVYKNISVHPTTK